MTILNNTSDGLHPELIVLFRTVASLGKATTDVSQTEFLILQLQPDYVEHCYVGLN
jgi:hypothetical protein